LISSRQTARQSGNSLSGFFVGVAKIQRDELGLAFLAAVVAVDPVMQFCIGQQNLYELPVVISKP
jgi:hypothetical protein